MTSATFSRPAELVDFRAPAHPAGAPGCGLTILFVYPWYPPTPKGLEEGGADYLKFLAESLADQGFQVHILTSGSAAAASAFAEVSYRGVLVHRIVDDWRWRAGFGSSGERIRRRLGQIAPEIIHVITPGARIGSRYSLPGVLPFLYSGALITTTVFHVISPRGVLNPFCWMSNLSLFGASRALHFVDEGTMQFFSVLFPFFRRPRVFIPCGSHIRMRRSWNAAECPELRRELGLDPAARWIAFYGYWYRNKNVDVLVRAAARLRARGLPVKLLFVGGDGAQDNPQRHPSARRYAASVRQLILDLGLAEHVAWTGYRDERTVENYLLSADLCVFPFKDRVVGRSSLIATLSLGMPILTSGGFQSSFLEHRENVFLSYWRDEKDLAADVETLLSDDTLRVRLAEGALRTSESLAWPNLANRWAELFMRTLVGPSAVRALR